MQKSIMVLAVLLFVVTGCAFFEKIAPSQLDESGKAIPGTHELVPEAKAVASNLGVYGEVAVGIPLLVWNFVERVRRKKSDGGLMATVRALKEAADDPNTKEAFELIKSKLKSAHKVAGVEGLIKGLIAKT